jgi:hypothetical protein
MWAPGGAAVQVEATVMRADVVNGGGAEVASSDVVMTSSGVEEAGGGAEKLGAGAA